MPAGTHPTVGVIGLGSMGGAMAANMVDSGLAVTGFDLDRPRVARLVALGGGSADSPADVADRVDVLVTSLPSQAAFEAVMVEIEHSTPAAQGGLVVVETSTLSVAAKERAHSALAPRGITLLDCPLSGTGDQAVHRDVIVLASGDRAAVARCEPVFAGFARAHHYLGDFGAGSKMKFVANLLVAIHNVAAAEALLLARAAGLDPQQTYDVISDSAGTSRMFEIRVPKMIAGDYEPGVRTSVFMKDLAIIRGFAEEHGVPVTLFTLCARLYDLAAESGFADQDTAAVFEILERARAGLRDQ